MILLREWVVVLNQLRGNHKNLLFVAFAATKKVMIILMLKLILLLFFFTVKDSSTSDLDTNGYYIYLAMWLGDKISKKDEKWTREKWRIGTYHKSAIELIDTDLVILSSPLVAAYMYILPSPSLPPPIFNLFLFIINEQFHDEFFVQWCDNMIHNPTINLMSFHFPHHEQIQVAESCRKIPKTSTYCYILIVWFQPFCLCKVQ